MRRQAAQNPNYWWRAKCLSHAEG